MLEARAINRYVNSSPRKMRLVIDLIRGRSVPEALAMLHFLPKHASKVAEKVVRSAVSNIQNKDDAGRINPESLYIKTVFVNGGPSLKRVLPAPMGRAYRMVKRSHHLTVVVAQREEKAQPVQQKVKTKAAEKKSAEKKSPEKKSEKE